MKRTLQNLSMLLLTFIVGMGSVWAQDETVFYTMDCPASTDSPAHSTYAAMYETVVNNITWQAPGNQYEDQAWRLGGKSLNGVDRYMYTVDAIETTVSKVVVSHGDISGATVNSFSLNVYSSAALAAAGGNGDVSSITGEYTANEDYTFTCPVDADWTNCYYRFTWNITVTQSGNKYIKLSSITFYQSDNSSVQQNPCATPTFSPEGGVYTTDQSVKLNSATEGTTIYYTIDGTTPTLNSLKYEGSIPVSETTTIKAIAVKEGMDVSKVASATFVFCQHAGNDKDPYNVDDARTAIDANTGITDVYATGIVSEIVTAYSDQYSNITFDIVTNNGDEVSLRVYRCGGDDAANVKVGDVVVVKGNLTTYGNIYEFAQGCELVSRESTDDRIETYISFDGVENDDNGAQVVNYELGEDFIAPTATLLNLDDDSEIPGVTFSYSSDNEKVATVTDNGITIIGAGTAVITVSYEGSDTYQPCELSYTIKVTANGGGEAPSIPTYTSLFEAFQAKTSEATEVQFTFDNVIVTGVTTNNAYLEDGRGYGALIYAKNHGFNKGDVLSGTVTCSIQDWKGALEFINLTSATEGLEIGSLPAEHAATETTVASLDAEHTGKYVTLAGLTCTASTGEFTYAGADATYSVVAYKTFITLPTFEEGATYTITGVYIYYDGKEEIAPLTADAIVKTSADVEKTYPQFTVTGLESVYTNGEFQFTVETEAPGLQVELEQTDLAELIHGEETGHYTLKTNGSEGGIILTITTEADDTYYALNEMYNVTIVYSQGGGEEPQFEIQDGVFDFTAGVDYGSGISTTNDNSYYETTPSTWTAVNITLVADGKYRWWTYSGSTLRFYSTSSMTFSAPAGYAITSISSNVTLSGFTAADGKLSGKAWTGEANVVTLTKESGTTVNISTITVEYQKADTYTRDVAEGDYGTLCLPRKAYVSGATVYEIAGVVKDDDKLTDLALAEHTGALEAGVAYVFHATSTQVVATLVGEAVAEAAQTTGLVGNLSAEDIKTPDGCYVLVDGVLRQVQGGTAYIQTNRAYFKLDDVAEYSEDEPTAGVKLINISFNEDATAINGINATTADGTIYNLQGQRVNSLQRGINVVNGKKVLVK